MSTVAFGKDNHKTSFAFIVYISLLLLSYTDIVIQDQVKEKGGWMFLGGGGS